MEIKNIFFDLDHTLWDFEKNSALTFELLFKKYNLDIDLNSFLVVYVPINLEYWRLYRNEVISKEYLRYNRLNDVFKKLNINVSSDLINKISYDYIENLPKFNYLIDGAHELLLYLKISIIKSFEKNPDIPGKPIKDNPATVNVKNVIGMENLSPPILLIFCS